MYGEDAIRCLPGRASGAMGQRNNLADSLYDAGKWFDIDIAHASPFRSMAGVALTAAQPDQSVGIQNQLLQRSVAKANHAR